MKQLGDLRDLFAISLIRVSHPSCGTLVDFKRVSVGDRRAPPPTKSSWLIGLYAGSDFLRGFFLQARYPSAGKTGVLGLANRDVGKARRKLAIVGVGGCRKPAAGPR